MASPRKIFEKFNLTNEHVSKEFEEVQENSPVLRHGSDFCGLIKNTKFIFPIFNAETGVKKPVGVKLVVENGKFLAWIRVHDDQGKETQVVPSLDYASKAITGSKRVQSTDVLVPQKFHGEFIKILRDHGVLLGASPSTKNREFGKTFAGSKFGLPPTEKNSQIRPIADLTVLTLNNMKLIHTAQMALEELLKKLVYSEPRK